MTAFVLVFARCAGFASRAPGFAHPSVTPAVRAGLALFLAVGLSPGVHPYDARIDGIVLIVALVTEFLIGSAIGMVASLVYDGAYAGGRAVDDYIGVKAIAPSLQLVAPSGFGRIWSLAYTGAFFLTGAYRVTILALAHSFDRIAPGAPFDAHAWAPYAVGLASTIVLVAVGVAAPAIALAFVVQIGLGALSRAVPRFGSVTLAFPLAFAAALVATVIVVPALAQHVTPPVVTLPVRHP
ncbi:MAG TPA: flagellar biosynthetic protein FliR [Candidatus Baltobacteraceae bacterium]|nr:flagellar biosynthetic protein FliR [Candidatus Baltobacteraceae bacterium]